MLATGFVDSARNHRTNRVQKKCLATHYNFVMLWGDRPMKATAEKADRNALGSGRRPEKSI